ncbi:MAG: 50S ribosomal protein L16 [archaeon]
MVGLRPFCCYRKVKRAYTRKSKYKSKGFIKSVPVSKIVKFNFGDLKRDFSKKVNLLSKQRIQIRHNAIESARVMVVRQLNKTIGKNYHFQIRIYPHHVLRENKMITGAGADRMQTGMQHAFGKAMGLAAQVKPKQALFTVYVDKEGVDAARKALQACASKLPCKCGVEIV